MNACGFWAHCALHCDLPCDHKEWCPDYPVRRSNPSNRAVPWLRRLANRIGRAS